MNIMIEEWVEQLLEKNNILNTDNLRKDMIIDEINEIKGSIKNEIIWVLGSKTDGLTNLHLENIENLEEYIEFLEKLLPQEDSC